MKYQIIQTTLLAVLLIGFIPPPAQAANVDAILSFSPSTGSFVIGSTFDVSVFLNTQGQSVNTIELNIKYPPDELQLVSSSTGKSIIGIWTALPKYDNALGKLSMIGGIPGGVTVSQGLITTLTFRAKAGGSAVIKFDSSRVLLNDGLGTEVRTQTQNSIYNLVLPPPGGPIVTSSTHPNQTQWYSNSSAELSWNASGGSEGYSFILNDSPIDTPDNITEGNRTSVAYDNLADGRRYFHIRSLRNGQWGGITHFAINVDTSPPAEFQVEVTPGAKTTRKQPVLQFATTDAHSGLDHFELRIVPLSKAKAADNENELFIEAQSPYISNPLDLGKYDVIIRAFDKSGNVREVVQRLDIVTAALQFIADRGLEVKSTLIIPWWLISIILLLLVLSGALVAYRTRLWHDVIHRQHINQQMPRYIKKQIRELNQYRQRYGKLAMIFLIGFTVLGVSHLALAAEEEQVLAPPVITTVSTNITNEEIFYVGGRTGVSNNSVIIYIQNVQTTATLSAEVATDKNGEWFYRGDSFLTPGNYVVWSQTKAGEQQSAPSAQIKISVEASAIQIGATKFSYATIYLALLLLAILLLIILGAYIIYHYRHGQRKHGLLQKQISEAEASLRRGFAVLNRDIESELAIIKQVKLGKQLSVDEKKREEQLLKDIKDIEQYLSKEIWQIEDTEIRT